MYYDGTFHTVRAITSECSNTKVEVVRKHTLHGALCEDVSSVYLRPNVCITGAAIGITALGTCHLMISAEKMIKKTEIVVEYGLLILNWLHLKKMHITSGLLSRCIFTYGSFLVPFFLVSSFPLCTCHIHRHAVPRCSDRNVAHLFYPHRDKYRSQLWGHTATEQ